MGARGSSIPVMGGTGSYDSRYGGLGGPGTSAPRVCPRLPAIVRPAAVLYLDDLSLFGPSHYQDCRGEDSISGLPRVLANL
jgi:hypothetical protein